MEDSLRDIALRQAAACARAKYPGEDKRIERGLLLALNGKVEIGIDEAYVQSDRDPEVVYTVSHGHCECPDRYNAPDGRCKHVIAAWLTKIALAALNRSPLSPTPPASCR